MELKTMLPQHPSKIRIRSYSDDMAFPSQIKGEKNMSQTVTLEKQNDGVKSFPNLPAVKTVIINL